jgi:TetR/AcrR family transcriptional regulator, transcriptional repressor for nem operon
MPYPPEHKHDTRQKILDSARRLFNKKGFNEVSIEEVMSNVGLTHGGFYRYFSGKDELYADAVRQFLCGQAPEPWQIAQRNRCIPGRSRAHNVVDAYLSREHFDDHEGCCPLIGVPSDVSRSGDVVKAAYREVVENLVQLFEADLKGPDRRERALAILTLCVGGMVVGRAIEDQALADDFRKAAHKQVLMTADWSEG